MIGASCQAFSTEITLAPPAAQSAPSAPAKMEKLSGTLERVDQAAKEIVVKKGSAEKTLTKGKAGGVIGFDDRLSL